MYALISNDTVEIFPYAIYRLRKDNKHISFPHILSNEVLALWGVYPVIENTPVVGKFQKIKRATVPVKSGDNWVLNHMVVDWDIDDVKKVVKETLKDDRKAAGLVPINGFDVAMPEDRENISGAIDYYDIITSNGTVDLVWTMEDNTERVVTLSDLKGARDGYVLRKAQIFADYQAKKQAIENATTIAEIETILGS